jgi:hypothetical protein
VAVTVHPIELDTSPDTALATTLVTTTGAVTTQEALLAQASYAALEPADRAHTCVK